MCTSKAPAPREGQTRVDPFPTDASKCAGIMASRVLEAAGSRTCEKPPERIVRNWPGSAFLPLEKFPIRALLPLCGFATFIIYATILGNIVRLKNVAPAILGVPGMVGDCTEWKTRTQLVQPIPVRPFHCPPIFNQYRRAESTVMPK